LALAGQAQIQHQQTVVLAQPVLWVHCCPQLAVVVEFLETVAALMARLALAQAGLLPTVLSILALAVTLLVHLIAQLGHLLQRP
jgi:hypothetical protein